MQTTTKVRAALMAAAVMVGVGAATTGVALAAPAAPAAAPTTVAAQATPGTGDEDGESQDNTELMDQMDELMAQMVQNLPDDQRDAATAMHEQMRPAMQQMMSGDMSGMDEMGPGMDAMMGDKGHMGG